MLESESDVGVRDGCWKRDSVAASKDIAESPTAKPERPEKVYSVENYYFLNSFFR